MGNYTIFLLSDQNQKKKVILEVKSHPLENSTVH